MVQPLAYSATPNAFFLGVAREAPRGTYPRSFIGEQSYWTVVGVSGDTENGLLGEDGAVEPARGSFSVEPFLFLDGKLLRWSDVEIEHSLELLHPDVIFTARKGTFGHGMSVGGGWELTAQHLGMAKGHLYGIALTEGELHADVKVHDAKFVQTDGCNVEAGGYAGKLSMGVGGTNSCVISRTWDPEYVEAHLRSAAVASTAKASGTSRWAPSSRAVTSAVRASIRDSTSRPACACRRARAMAGAAACSAMPC